MIRFLLIAILVLVDRARVLALVDGIIDGGRGSRTPRRSARPVKLVRDPVCGTYVAPARPLSLTAGGTTHYFCSEECRARYRAA